jgi:hypothetical protein
MTVKTAASVERVRREIRFSSTDIVEEYDTIVVLKRRRHITPHVAVATEAMRKDDRLVAHDPHHNVISADDIHAHTIGVSEQKDTPSRPLLQRWYAVIFARNNLLRSAAAETLSGHARSRRPTGRCL